MRKQKLNTLKLNKESITNLDGNQIKGGHGCPTQHYSCQNSCWCDVTRVAERCPV
ncbi:hypothetical protein [Kordia jejudonensis]|uniref:hypothetical protein n=1 Tax=Kordia jejudonensis TaxID=1348245 RepID=UPI0012E05C40|nr:hypothetical protein [Kordia jejudonensis]